MRTRTTLSHTDLARLLLARERRDLDAGVERGQAHDLGASVSRRAQHSDARDLALLGHLGGGRWRGGLQRRAGPGMGRWKGVQHGRSAAPPSRLLQQHEPPDLIDARDLSGANWRDCSSQRARGWPRGGVKGGVVRPAAHAAPRLCRMHTHQRRLALERPARLRCASAPASGALGLHLLMDDSLPLLLEEERKAR